VRGDVTSSLVRNHDAIQCRVHKNKGRIMRGEPTAISSRRGDRDRAARPSQHELVIVHGRLGGEFRERRYLHLGRLFADAESALGQLKSPE